MFLNVASGSSEKPAKIQATAPIAFKNSPFFCAPPGGSSASLSGSRHLPMTAIANLAWVRQVPSEHCLTISRACVGNDNLAMVALAPFPWKWLNVADQWTSTRGDTSEVGCFSG